MAGLTALRSRSISNALHKNESNHANVIIGCPCQKHKRCAAAAASYVSKATSRQLPHIRPTSGHRAQGLVGLRFDQAAGGACSGFLFWQCRSAVVSVLLAGPFVQNQRQLRPLRRLRACNRQSPAGGDSLRSVVREVCVAGRERAASPEAEIAGTQQGRSAISGRIRSTEPGRLDLLELPVQLPPSRGCRRHQLLEDTFCGA